MSEWGRVALYYDYEKDDKYRGRIRVRGLISKAYKYPGTINMILHAYYGLGYLYERRKSQYPDFSVSGENWDNRLSGWRELNAAFDVLFHESRIDLGISKVEDAITGDEMSDEEMRYHVFGCEGTDGFLNILMTGNPEDGYKVKYGYQYLREEEGMDGRTLVKDLRRALSLDRDAPYYMEDPEVKESVEGAISAIEEVSELMTDEEFRTFENLGVAWIRDMREERRLEKERIAAEEAERERIRQRIESGQVTDEDPISYLDIGGMYSFTLYRAGIETIGQLRQMTDEQLLAIEHITPKRLARIRKRQNEVTSKADDSSGKLPRRKK